MATKLTTMNVSLPAVLRNFVQKQVDTGGFANASEYIRHLIREKQRTITADPELNELLWEGINSGPGVPMDDKFWKRVNEKARRKASSSRRPVRKAG